MRKLTIEELDFVSGGELNVGDVLVGAGNGIGTGNHAMASNIGNSNTVLNDVLNDSGHGAGIGNFSFS